ncbi:MAG: PKD domain-containing protein [Fluviicola sp.]
MKIFTLLLVIIPFLAFSQTPPTANFTGNPLSACIGSPVNFNSTSIVGTAPITSYSWDFGDGFSSTGQTTSHVYTAVGTYTVTLVVQASNGQADAEVKVNYITVNPLPTANFTASTNGCTLPVSVTFTNTSVSGSTYAWNFDNGSTSVNANPPVQTYTTAGTYDVSLIVTNSFGCKDTIIEPIVISNFQAGISAPITACEDVPVSINNNSTVGANVFNWTFTGATPATSSSENNSITYDTPGNYSITLNAQNSGSGCNDSETINIQILPKPNPTFTATPLVGCAPLPVAFTNTSGAGTTFVWDFGDGATFTGSTPGSHTYLGNGTYNATVTMTAANGCSATSAPVTIVLTSPISSFTSDVVNGCALLDVQFTSTATATTPIATWVWNFGDGTLFNGQNPPVHTYDVGVYDVTLTVTTASGCIGTVTVADYIQVGEIDLVNFSIDATPACAKTDVDFTDLSIISAPHTPSEVTYLWNFGDGQTSTSQNPTHVYQTDTGFFDVSLIINFRGCLDTLSLTDAVYIKAPISLFNITTPLVCNPPSFPVNIVTDDNSIIGEIPDDCQMIWKWGDGTTTTFDDPIFDDADLGSTNHNYTAYGTYTIEQVIYNFTTGCSDSTTQTVHISQTIAGISPLANDSVCVGVSFPMTENSTSTHPFGTFSWNMGNGATVSGATTSYAYPSFGTFTITLTATNSVGCADDATFNPMTALANPLAQITSSDNAGCAPFLVTFTNSSIDVDNGVPLESFQFTFSDDGSTQSTNLVGQTVNHTFNTEGSFNVSLVATDQFGCVSSPAIAPISVTKPIAQFLTDSVYCEAEQVGTNNTSTGFGLLTYQWFVDGTSTSTSQDFIDSYSFPENGSAATPVVYSLIVTDGNGCKDTLTNTIQISHPVAIIDYDLSGAATNANGDFLCPPVFATFTDNSNSLGNITNYTWNFGDGKTSTLTNPNNTYVFPGTYSVSMTITDEFGCISDTTLTDYLTIFGPQAQPDWSTIPGLCGQDIAFTLGNTTNVTNVVWTFDDGTTGTDTADFIHTYLDVSTFFPSVTVFDSNNCQVLYPLDSIVIPENGLNAQFTASSTELSLGDNVIFDDVSTFGNPLVSWTWTLGANPPTFTNNSGVSVSNYYVTPGPQVITLLIEDNIGCFDSYTLTINVDGSFELPNVFTPGDNDVNNTFSFKIDIFESWNVLVVNRWGSVMTEKRNQTGTLFWDGTSRNGKPAEDGVYFYILDGTLKDGSSFKKEGYVQLFGKQ